MITAWMSFYKKKVKMNLNLQKTWPLGVGEGLRQFPLYSHVRKILTSLLKEVVPIENNLAERVT